MDRAHREDSAYERACTDAARALQKVLDSPRCGGRYQTVLEDARRICEAQAAHIVAVWD